MSQSPSCVFHLTDGAKYWRQSRERALPECPPEGVGTRKRRKYEGEREGKWKISHFWDCTNCFQEPISAEGISSPTKISFPHSRFFVPPSPFCLMIPLVWRLVRSFLQYVCLQFARAFSYNTHGAMNPLRTIQGLELPLCWITETSFFLNQTNSWAPDVVPSWNITVLQFMHGLFDSNGNIFKYSNVCILLW